MMGSTTSALLGLTWGGIQFAWSSAQVLAPLIVGLVGIGGFFLYEAFVATEPLVRDLRDGQMHGSS